MGARFSQSSIFIKNEVPGPGTYKPINVTHTSGAKYSIKGKYKVGTSLVITPDGGHEKMVEGSDFNVPGPGSYKPSTS